ncbi:EamA family transporter [Nocardioides acrostichi]|uniref:DMT family transporter n=1 Tax=Nocardioides acrostichi TaxID=2784339 RepID=A0A930V129_9ACTN|nr:DMT family transporter [Nocardioides acrostichi]MBF4161926.1 DMT family transporter [Nocardioides acrostichi]
MSTMTHDNREGVPAVTPRASLATGLGIAVVSALSFGLSGPLGRGLLDTGWSPGAAVLVRVLVAAVVVLPLGLVALRGRWHLLRDNAGLVLLYGGLAVAGAQVCFFSAVQYMQVGPALLIEYTAPAAVVSWLWLRHGQRPTLLTVVGAGLAALGLVLVLDVTGGAEVSVPGVLWALGAMVGLAVYFLISADDDNGLPPLTLAAGGLVSGGAIIAVLGVAGVLPLTASTAPAVYDGRELPWWGAALLLALVTAAFSYVTGIEAGRRLGSRLASFVGLTEVLAAIGFAWLLLGELPRGVQLLGGLAILAGVVCVRLGEPRVDEAATTEIPTP